MQERGLDQLTGRTKFTEASDSLVLEDESARMQLKGAALPVGDTVTGVVVAIKGAAVPGGDFWVSVQPPSPLPVHLLLHQSPTLKVFWFQEQISPSLNIFQANSPKAMRTAWFGVLVSSEATGVLQPPSLTQKCPVS